MVQCGAGIDACKPASAPAFFAFRDERGNPARRPACSQGWLPHEGSARVYALLQKFLGRRSAEIHLCNVVCVDGGDQVLICGGDGLLVKCPRDVYAVDTGLASARVTVEEVDRVVASIARRTWRDRWGSVRTVLPRAPAHSRATGTPDLDHAVELRRTGSPSLTVNGSSMGRRTPVSFSTTRTTSGART